MGWAEAARQLIEWGRLRRRVAGAVLWCWSGARPSECGGRRKAASHRKRKAGRSSDVPIATAAGRSDLEFVGGMSKAWLLVASGALNCLWKVSRLPDEVREREKRESAKSGREFRPFERKALFDSTLRSGSATDTTRVSCFLAGFPR